MPPYLTYDADKKRWHTIGKKTMQQFSFFCSNHQFGNVLPRFIFIVFVRKGTACALLHPRFTAAGHMMQLATSLSRFAPRRRLARFSRHFSSLLTEDVSKLTDAQYLCERGSTEQVRISSWSGRSMHSD